MNPLRKATLAAAAVALVGAGVAVMPTAQAAPTAPTAPTRKVTWDTRGYKFIYVTNPYDGKQVLAGTLYQRQKSTNKRHLRYDLYLKPAISFERKVAGKLRLLETWRVPLGNANAAYFGYVNGQLKDMGALNQPYYTDAPKQIRDYLTGRVLPIYSTSNSHKIVTRGNFTKEGKPFVSTKGGTTPHASWKSEYSFTK